MHKYVVVIAAPEHLLPSVNYAIGNRMWENASCYQLLIAIRSTGRYEYIFPNFTYVALSYQTRSPGSMVTLCTVPP